jgi:hypothetical protein
MAATKIWKDTIRQDTCRSARCGRRIWWAQVVKSGRFMCFDQAPEALVTEVELETHREQITVDLAPNHYATCPGRQEFRRAK